MENFIVGFVSGIGTLILFMYIVNKIIDTKYKEEISEANDYETRIKPKDTELHHNVTICIKDDIYTAEHLDEDNNIIAFMDFHPKNIERADFYYSLFANKQVIIIDYNFLIYQAIITEIKLTDYNTLRIYYHVINND